MEQPLHLPHLLKGVLGGLRRQHLGLAAAEQPEPLLGAPLCIGLEPGPASGGEGEARAESGEAEREERLELLACAFFNDDV